MQPSPVNHIHKMTTNTNTIFQRKVRSATRASEMEAQQSYHDKHHKHVSGSGAAAGIGHASG